MRSKPRSGTGLKAIAFSLLTVAGICFGVCARASAQIADVGRAEYMSSCASCHGADARGGGPVATELKTPPADLTFLARKNGGVFPYDYVYQIIDGRGAPILSHGTREMPVWGYRFGPPQAFRYKARMLSVIDYLKTLQQR